jgi:chromosome segregation ATPase
MRRKLPPINNCLQTLFAQGAEAMAVTEGQPSETDAIAAAAARLSLALDALDAAAERRQAADRAAAALTAQVHALDADRARLASELDETAARARDLETANREVGTRIDQAIATIRDVLNSDV